jgi:cytochrome P450
MVNAVAGCQERVPPGPTESFDPRENLFRWMNENFLKYGDIYRASIFGTGVYVISNPEYCDRILRWNWRNYARSGQVVKRIALLLGNGLIASNGEFWASQRRMIQPAFTRKAICGYTSVIADANLELLHRWKLAADRREMVNVTQDVSLMVLRITLAAIFGDDYATVAPHFSVLADHSARNLQFAQSFHPLGKIIIQIAEQRRRDSRTASDILGTMMEARDRAHGEPMPDKQLAKEIMTLVVAGHETTAGILNWIWYLLSRHPESQTKLSDEFDQLPWSGAPTMDMLPQYTYTRQVIDEALRLYPPLWLMTRTAIGNDHLGDFFVPAGTEIYISPYLIQRSPGLWEVPDRFDPDRMSPDKTRVRHELAMCPFGAGPRNCIGESFARAETQIHLMMVAKELRLNHNELNSSQFTTGMNLLSKDNFLMTVKIKSRELLQINVQR